MSYVLFVLFVFSNGVKDVAYVPFDDRLHCEEAQVELMSYLKTTKLGANATLDHFATVCVPVRSMETKT